MLALVGSGEYLPPMELVDRELLRRLPGPPRVACLPTASGAEDPARAAYWSELGVAHFQRLDVPVTAVPVLDRMSAHASEHIASIRAANYVYLSGGRPDYLARTLTGTPVWAAILAVVADGGLLAGCSAGAMIMGERFLGAPRSRRGFNLLPGVMILPHYDEMPGVAVRLIRRLAARRMTLVGIDGSTALTGTGSQWEVLGHGGVTIWQGNTVTRYGVGPMPLGVLPDARDVDAVDSDPAIM